MLGNIRCIDGEPVVYKGYLWFIKGYQHPPDKIIAFPRYNLINSSHVTSVLQVVDQLYYWDCLKIEVPVIKLDEIMLYKPGLDNFIEYIVDTIVDMIGIDREDCVVSGSTLLGRRRDLDIVVYGFSEEYISNIEKLLRERVFERIRYDQLYYEYLSKHVKDTDLYTYMYIKKDTILHFLFNNVHVNLRFNRFSRGVHGCVDPVYKREFFIGEIHVLKPIFKYVIPSKYLIRWYDRVLYLESYREIYSELPVGRYYVEGFIEHRRDGEYIVPDHGRLIYLS
ncbi:MAG: hypothetical protein B6U89_06430 [Desulfurococcales archaeon ex4484_58]|nr:MAG: hypothetical protein B6U89_06430 [Desulfurococcales archaeon ex4484_58]